MDVKRCIQFNTIDEVTIIQRRIFESTANFVCKGQIRTSDICPLYAKSVFHKIDRMLAIQVPYAPDQIYSVPSLLRSSSFAASVHRGI